MPTRSLNLKRRTKSNVRNRATSGTHYGMHFDHGIQYSTAQMFLGYRHLHKLLEERYGSPIPVERSDDFGELLRVGKALVAVQIVARKLSIIMFDRDVATEVCFEITHNGINDAVNHIVILAAQYRIA